jgi:hypothetical protein
MTTRKFENKSGEVWTWEETPETVAAVKQLHDTIRKNKEKYANVSSNK